MANFPTLIQREAQYPLTPGYIIGEVDPSVDAHLPNMTWLTSLSSIEDGSTDYATLDGLERKMLELSFMTFINHDPYGDSSVLGAFLKGTMVGIAIYTLPNDGSDEVNIRNLATDPAHQERGVASSLLQLCEMTVREAGWKTIILDSSNSASKFYRKRGYRPFPAEGARNPMIKLF